MGSAKLFVYHMRIFLEFPVAVSPYSLLEAAGGFVIGGCIYLINEMTGRKIMRMAIGPVAAIATGIILNLTYLIGLTPLV